MIIFALTISKQTTLAKITGARAIIELNYANTIIPSLSIAQLILTESTMTLTAILLSVF